MYLKTIVQNEAQCGKGPVEAHFDVSMRHIYSYMVQHSADCATPAQVVYAPRSNGGVRNSAVALLHIKPNGKNTRKWADGKHNNRMKSLGHVMEIQHDRVSNGTVQVVVYEQSGFGEAYYVLGQCWMKKMRNGVSPDGTVGTSRNYVVVRGPICERREHSTGNGNVEITERNETLSILEQDGGGTSLHNKIVYNNNPLLTSNNEDAYMVEQCEVYDCVLYADIHSAHRGCTVTSDSDVFVDRRYDTREAIFNELCTEVIVLESYDT